MQPGDNGITECEIGFQLDSDGGQESQLPSRFGSPVQPLGLVR